MSDVVKYGLMWIFNRLIPQKMFKAQREQQRATRDKKIRWFEDLYSLEGKPVVANKQTFTTASKNLRILVLNHGLDGQGGRRPSV